MEYSVCVSLTRSPFLSSVRLRGIEQEGPALELRLLRLLGRAQAAAERVHARNQLRGGEGLRHIVVRAVHEPGDLVHLLAQRGEHDDAHLGAGGAYPAADLEAVYVRQHDVQQRHVYVRVGRYGRQRLLARRRLDRLIAVAAQVYNDKAAYAALVFQNQYLLDLGHAPFWWRVRPAGWPTPPDSTDMAICRVLLP